MLQTPDSEASLGRDDLLPSEGVPSAADATVSDPVRASVDALYAQEFPLVVRFVMYNGANFSDAQDAAQEAFAEAYKKVNNGSWCRVHNPGAWVRFVALRRCRRPPDTRNSVLADPVAEPVEQQAETHPHELADQTIDALAALRHLDPPLRAVMAFFLDDYTAKQTAEMMGISPGKVTDLRAKARRKLRRYYESEWRAR